MDKKIVFMILLRKSHVKETLFQNLIKGLVHPKMKIKSLITHPHAVPTP